MPKLTDAHVVQSNRCSTVAQIAEKADAGSDRKMSGYTVGMELHSYRPFKVPILTPIHQQWGLEHQIWTMFCWETSGPSINVAVNLTRTTYISLYITAEDHVHANRIS